MGSGNELARRIMLMCPFCLGNLLLLALRSAKILIVTIITLLMH